MSVNVWSRPVGNGVGDGYLLDAVQCARAHDMIRSWSFYRASPLRSLDAMASELKVGQILALDESRREPLKSFKMLGAVYAAAEAVARRSGGRLDAGEVYDHGGCLAELLGHTRLVAASDGNHGRALAWAAERLGAGCTIYLPSNVSTGREQRIRDYGATTVRVDGSYDEAVDHAHRDAMANDWIIIQDTALAGFEEYCFDIMHGYSLMAREGIEQMGERPPTHAFLQAGVGGFAAATASYLASRFGQDRPLNVVVESEMADCVLASLRAGQRTAVGGDHDTKMVGIACGEVSEIAWDILSHLADHAVTLDDTVARDALRMAARLEPRVEIGETGIAGLAAIAAVCTDEGLRQRMKIDANSTLLAFITEGITDETAYQAFLTGA